MTILTNAERKHLERSITVAETSTCTNRHGAVIASGRRVLAVGVNSFRANPDNVTNASTEASFHAEVAAIRGSRRDLRGCTIFVGRITKGNNIGLSRPCVRCEEAIKEVGIKRVVYTTGKAGFNVINF